MGSNREGSQAGIEFATADVGSINGSEDLNPSEVSKRDTGDYWSDKSGSDDTSKGSTSLAAGSQADSKESKLIRCSGCVKAATAKKVGGMHVFKKTQNHARAHNILAARHCSLCERCLQVSIDCVPADSGSYKIKCKPCNGKSHPPCHHKFWLGQSLVTKWDGLVSQGKTHVVADVMVYSSLAVFGHQQYDKVRLNNYPTGVAPKILRAHCGNKFDEIEPLENPFCSNKTDQGKTSGAGYEESNINSAYRSVDIAKGTHAEAALERISTAAKGLVECFGINNHSEEELKEEASLEALEDFADTMIGQLQ
ncbi:uncharacterized protein UBRO_20225 [Ustilago bromivora]|uniref:Uncharacterized protein n=1 Tax=Ustilago bromivora TaxID=307758 RepID=A0A1K0HCH3_9BASI|nr:uncharacterized protein UBRO_20225 [Ustilago bromivora]